MIRFSDSDRIVRVSFLYRRADKKGFCRRTATTEMEPRGATLIVPRSLSRRRFRLFEYVPIPGVSTSGGGGDRRPQRIEPPTPRRVRQAAGPCRSGGGPGGGTAFFESGIVSGGRLILHARLRWFRRERYLATDQEVSTSRPASTNTPLFKLMVSRLRCSSLIPSSGFVTELC